MLKGLIEKLKHLTREPVPYDPSVLGDPIAMQTEWTPAKKGGASFRTHKLVNVDSFRMEFRPSAGAKAFYGLFLVIGIGVLVGFFVSGLPGRAMSMGGMFALPLLVPMIVGVVFTITGGAMLYYAASPRVFDKRRGVFWRGRSTPYGALTRGGNKDSADFEDIHALQIVSEHIRSDKSSYYSYELNLVLRNGSRINVVDHGDVDALREDARTLSDFLGKPVWDSA